MYIGTVIFIANGSGQYAILNGCDLASEYIIDTTDDVNIKNAKGLSALLASIIEAEPTDSAGYSRKADAVEYLVQPLNVVRCFANTTTDSVW